MKYRYIIAAAAASLLSVFASAQTPQDSLVFVNTDWGWQDIGKGAQAGYADLNIFGASESISVIRYPMRKYKTAIGEATGENCTTTPKLAEALGATIACNGSYFNMRKLTPVTFITIAHQQLGSVTKNETFRTDGLVAIKGKCGKKVEIFAYDTLDNERLCKKYYSVLSSGPLLIKDGKTIPCTKTTSFFTGRHPRTIIGISPDKYIYMIVIDGRWKEHSAGATIPETAAVARYFGLVDALNLDGGGSSTCWSAQTGVINHPNDNGKWDHEGCRRDPNIVWAK